MNADELVAEIETDKTSVEVPAPFSGTIVELLVQDGEKVVAKQKLYKLEKGEGGASVSASPQKSEPKEEKAPPKKEEKPAPRPQQPSQPKPAAPEKAKSDRKLSSFTSALIFSILSDSDKFAKSSAASFKAD